MPVSRRCRSSNSDGSLNARLCSMRGRESPPGWRLLWLISCLLLSACDKSTETEAVVASTSKPKPELTLAVMQKWTRSCALCHVNGIGGAPRTGAFEEWKPRLAEGKPMLLKHTVEGYNNMPPLGYCMSCEEEDFVALIDFMLGETP